MLLISCQKKEQSKEALLYKNHCARCHIVPDIQDLPKNIWQKNILPDMGARMGISTPGYNPLEGYSYEEQLAMMQSNTYPNKPTISAEDWKILQDYIIELAPDSLVPNRGLPKLEDSEQFETSPVKIDNQPGSFITYLHYRNDENEMILGDMQGNLKAYDFKSNTLKKDENFGSPVIAYNSSKGKEYYTQIGQLNPSEIPTGAFSVKKGESLEIIFEDLHRPVHTLTEDLDGDGKDEFVISEFGNLTGQITLAYQDENAKFQKKLLLNQPGVIRVLAEDMDGDGKKDLVALTSQGDESIMIFYQTEALEFRRDKAIRFSPVYGSSWFELMDYDHDGDMDIATVHGDNADKSSIPKPYHGLRIHLNDGENNFTESYFYPLNGATRVLARDFDQDKDIDFAIIATFPDYENAPKRSFIYLENTDAENFKFLTSTFEDVDKARWFLMDAGDIDQDGDLDIILSSFSYSFIPIPKEIQQKWGRNEVDLIILKNKLK
ncbi:FG-GAP repeat domain-containing protein [Christiangramia antarctica]|uniref:FG-GAP repeat domain-containing protein n=1 Tax=Christiangramia antarctica TaxID=2058158 RepID=A0ABW5X488_9FLAO